MFRLVIRGDYIFNGVFGFIWLSFVWEKYLSFRQRKVYLSTKEVPKDLTEIMDKDTFDKAKRYQLDRNSFGFWRSLSGQIEITVILLLNLMPKLWHYSGYLMFKYTGLESEHEVLQTIIFAVVGSIISTVFELPWSIYGTFVIEERHGFNKQTLGFFIKDKIKKFLVSQIIMIPIIASVVEIIAVGGEYLFLYLWLFTFSIAVLLTSVYADYIAPLFDKFSVLPEGELKQKIENLAASVNFPLKKLYVVEGSKRSAHSNAYFYGFFKNKRIVLFDTLLENYTPVNFDGENKSTDEDESQLGENDENALNEKKEANEIVGEPTNQKKKSGCTDDEVVAILAHELGHWKYNHVLKHFFFGQVNTFICFAVFGLLHRNQILYEAFGFYNTMPMFIGLLIIFQFIYMPYHEFLNFIFTLISRQYEFQADAFAKSLRKTAELRSSLIKLNRDNLEFPVYDWLYSVWHHSHPPLLQRLKALEKTE